MNPVRNYYAVTDKGQNQIKNRPAQETSNGVKLSCAFLFMFLFIIICPLLIAKPMTLEDCISIAKENNLQLLQAKMDIDQAWAGVTDANSSYYPSLGLSSGYRYGGDFSESRNGSFSSGINAQYTLYKGGSIRAGSKIAQTRVKIAEENYRQKEIEIVLSVKQAIFKILQTQEQISLINSILKRRNENLTLIKLNYNVGRENEPDVKQAEVSLRQTQYDYMKAEQNLTLAKLSLNRLLNQPEQEISIKYQDKVIEFPVLDSLTGIAKNERPEIISEKSNREVLEAQITQAKSSYFPSVSLSSSVGYSLQGDTLLNQKADWSAGINLSLPLFNGFSTKAKVREATISLKQNELNLQYLTNNVEAEVKQAYSDWQLANNNLEISNKTLEASRDAYQLTKLQYEQGRTSYFFLQQKESELTQAENSNVNAQYNLRASIAALEKSIGRSN